MKPIWNVAILIMVLVLSGFCSKEIVFIGLTGAQAPAIEKTFNRHFQEYLATMPGVRSHNTVEVARLWENSSSNFNNGIITPTLLASLRRFASDSTLVVWGRVKECMVRPERFWIVRSVIRGTLTVELSCYSLSNQQFVYIGDIKSSAIIKKGFVLWGSVEKAIQISADERSQVVDKIELKGVYASGRILSTIILNETNQIAKKGISSSDSIKIGERSADTVNPEKKNPLNEEPPFEEDDFSDLQAIESNKLLPAVDSLNDFEEPDTSGVDSTKEK